MQIFDEVRAVASSDIPATRRWDRRAGPWRPHHETDAVEAFFRRTLGSVD